MSYVILVRNPRNDHIIAVTSGDGNDPPIATYETEELAERDARNLKKV